MNEVVDKNVVKMEFNNKKFNSNIEDSMSLLDKFKEKLHFDKESKSAKELDENIGKISFATLTRETAKAIPGVTVLINLTNRLVDSAVNLSKSLTITPVLQGFQKYESEITSVQTIMNATGKTIDVVSKALEELTWYADETSYSLTTMSDSVGKFTAAGVGLEDSVAAVEGIANWAALSGQNAEKASRAMYNLSQAIGMGKLTAIDWRSIELANMGTEEFKKTVMETAKELGVLNDQFRTKGGFQVSVNNFRDSLSKGWVTNEVLVASLKKYASYSQQVYQIATRDGISAQEAMEKLGGSLEDVGVKGFKAAQESKTFTDAINAARDAVSSGWKKTFELIFGNYEEAKELWSGFAEELWNIFAQPASFRNELLQQWKELGGREKLLEGISTIYNKIADAVRQVRDAFREAIPQLTVKNLVDVTNKFLEFAKNLKISESGLETVKSLAKSLGYILKAVGTVLSAIFSVLPGIIHLLDPLISALSVVAQAVEGVLKLLVEGNGDFSLFGFAVNALAFIFESVAAAANILTSALAYLFDQIRESQLFKSLSEFFTYVKTNTKKLVNTIGDSVTKLFNKIKNSKALEYVVGFFGFIWSAIVQGITAVGNAISSFIKKVGESKAVQATIGFFVGIGNAIGDMFKDIGSFAEKAGGSVSDFFTTIGDRFKEGLGTLKSLIAPAIGVIVGLISKAWNWFKSLGIWETIKNMDFVKLAKAILDIAIAVKLFASALNGIKISNSINKLIKSFSARNYSEAIRNLAISFGILAASLAALSLVDANNLKNVASVLERLLIIMGSFATVLAIIATIASRGGKENAITEFIEQINPLTNVKESLRIRGIGLVLIGISVLIATFAKSVERLAAIEDSSKMLKASAAVLGALALIDAFVYVSGKLNEMPKAGQGILKKTLKMVGFFLGISAVFGGLSALIVKIAEWTKDADRLLEVGAAVGAAAIGFGILVAAFGKLYDSMAKAEAYAIDKITILRFAASIGAFALMMGAIGGSLALVNSTYTNPTSLWMSAAVITAMTAGLVGISFAMAGLYEVVARIDWREQNDKAFATLALIVVGIAGIIASVGFSVSMLAKAAVDKAAFTKAVHTLAAFAVLLAGLTYGVKKLLDLPMFVGSKKGYIEFENSMADVAIVMGGLAGTILAISGAITLLAKNIDDPNKILASGITIAATLAVFGTFVTLLSKSLRKIPSSKDLKISNLVSASIFMAAAVASIWGIVTAMRYLVDAGLDKPGWGASAIIIAGSMAALGVLVAALSKIKTSTLPNAGSFAIIAAGLTIISLIVGSLKDAFADLGENDFGPMLGQMAATLATIGGIISGLTAVLVMISKIPNINPASLKIVGGIFGIIAIAITGMTATVGLFAYSIKTFVDSIGDLAKNVESAQGALPKLANEMVNFANTIVANKDLMNEAMAIIAEVLPAMVLLENINQIKVGAGAASVVGAIVIAAGIVSWISALKNMKFGQMIAVLPILAVASKILIGIGLLVASVWLVKDVDPWKIAEVFIGSVGIILALTALFKGLSKIDKGALGKGVAVAAIINAIGAFLGELGILMVIFKDINPATIAASLFSIATVIAALGIVVFGAQSIKFRNSISVFTIIISLAGVIFAAGFAMNKLVGLEWTQIAAAFGGIAVTITAIGVCVDLINNIQPNIAKALSGIGSIMALSVDLLALTPILATLQSGLEKGHTGIGALAILLGTLAAAAAGFAALGQIFMNPKIFIGFHLLNISIELVLLTAALAIPILNKLADTIVHLVQSTVPIMKGFVEQLNILSTGLGVVGVNLLNSVAVTLDSLFNLIDNFFARVGETVGSAIPNLLGGFGSSFLNGFIEIGSWISRGLGKGILDKKQAATAAAEDLALSTKNTVHDTLEIGSPPPWAISYGEDSAEGLAIGLLNKTGDVEESGKYTAKTLIDSIKSVFTGDKTIGDAAQEALTGLGKNLGILDSDGKLTISAVLDLDKYQSQYDEFMKSVSKDVSLNIGSSIARLPREEGYNVNLPAGAPSTYGRGTVVFNQYNQSPKALSEVEIYRSTRNLVTYGAEMVKGGR